MVHLVLGELKNDGYMFIKSVVFLTISVKEKYILELWLSQKSIKGYLKMRCFLDLLKTNWIYRMFTHCPNPFVNMPFHIEVLKM